MEKKLLILATVLLSSCGVNHNVSDSKMTVDPKPAQVTVNIDNKLMEAAYFCDFRYGYKTPESEECFKDFRTYFRFTVDFSEEIAVATCIARSTDPAVVEACIEDLSQYYTKE